jgi:hypothetical protein
VISIAAGRPDFGLFVSIRQMAWSSDRASTQTFAGATVSCISSSSPTGRSPGLRRVSMTTCSMYGGVWP